MNYYIPSYNNRKTELLSVNRETELTELRVAKHCKFLSYRDYFLLFSKLFFKVKREYENN